VVFVLLILDFFAVCFFLSSFYVLCPMLTVCGLAIRNCTFRFYQTLPCCCDPSVYGPSCLLRSVTNMHCIWANWERGHCFVPGKPQFLSTYKCLILRTLLLNISFQTVHQKFISSINKGRYHLPLEYNS
jgi:hypothetical protein